VITGIFGWQDCGKTLTMVACAYQLYFGLGLEVPVGNVVLPNIKGAVALSIPALRVWMKRMIDEGLTNRIILIDEIDRVFPARFWKDREQSEALIGLWQDVKLNNHVIYTAHIGVTVDVMIRSSTRIVVLPEYDKKSDTIELMVFDGRYGLEDLNLLCDASEWFGEYNRWQIVR